MNQDQKPQFHGRTAARLAAIQALYQLEQEPISVSEVVIQFLARRFKQTDDVVYDKVDVKLFEMLVEGVSLDKTVFDDKISLTLAESWRLDRLESVMLSILRAAAFELKGHTAVPKAVIINEYVNITKAFYSGNEPAFVNASLDRLSEILAE